MNLSNSATLIPPLKDLYHTLSFSSLPKVKRSLNKYTRFYLPDYIRSKMKSAICFFLYFLIHSDKKTSQNITMQNI